MKKPNHYSTSCFNTACWLRYNEIPLLSVENDGRKKVWVFVKNDELDSAMEIWLKGNPTVGLQHFLAIQKFMKSTIYQVSYGQLS